MSNQRKRALAWVKIHQDNYGTGHKSVTGIHTEPKEAPRAKSERKSWFVRGSNKKN